MVDVGSLYGEARARVTELVSGLGPEEQATRVPTCPEWTVKDVVSHLAGVCSDILAGNLEGVATDPWTNAQVTARRDRSLEDVLAEWNEAAPQVEPLTAHFPGRVGVQLLMDQTTHEHDIRAALRRPGARDTAAVRAATDFLVTGGLGVSLAMRGLGPIEVRADGQTWVVGSREPMPGTEDEVVTSVLMGGDLPAPVGEPVAALEASHFELLRALSGRRSRDQIRKLGWTADPEPYVDGFQFGPFTLRDSDIEE